MRMGSRKGHAVGHCLIVLGAIFFATTTQAIAWQDQITAGTTKVRGQHMAELKAAVEAKYLDPSCIAQAAANGHPGLAIATTSVFPTNLDYTPIKSDLFMYLRTAVRTLYTDIGQAQITSNNVWATGVTTIAGNPLSARDITDLRAAVDAVACTSSCVITANCNCNGVCEFPPESCIAGANYCADCGCTVDVESPYGVTIDSVTGISGFDATVLPAGPTAAVNAV